MTHSEIVESLRKEAQENPACNAVFHMFALRRRARSELTLDALEQKMISEGFTYPRSDYEYIIRFLAKLGFGALHLGNRGQVKALKTIKTTLQSIGQAAINKGETFETIKARARYTNLSPRTRRSPVTTSIENMHVPRPTNKAMDLSIELNVNNRPVKISVPKDFGKNDLIELLDRIQSSA